MKPDEFMNQKYGLSENPFLDRIAREIWLETWVDRKEELGKWKKIILDSALVEKNYIVFIIGDYGRGKTLSLLKVTDEAKQYNTILPVYLNFKEEQRTKNPGLDFMFRIFRGIDFRELGRKGTNRELKNALDSISDDLDEVRNVLAKTYLGNGEEKKLALYFLRGEIKPTRADLRKLGVIRKIEDVDIAKEYLAGLLGFIKGRGFSTLLLAIDEFEYLFSLVTKPQRSIYLALLRGLYDFPVGMNRNVGDIAKMTFFIAISEDGRRRLKDMEKEERSGGGPIQPLLRRVDAETSLKPFDKNETKELVVKRLRFNRIKGKYQNRPLIPFKEDFVKFIYEITRGEPADIITKCAHVLDAGLEKGVSLLDKNFAKKALRERGGNS